MQDVNSMITILRDQMSEIKLMDPDRPPFKSLRATLDKADNKTLKILYDAKIQFVSSLALNRLARRGVKL